MRWLGARKREPGDPRQRFTTEMFADAVGASATQVRRWRRGVQVLDRKFAERIRALQVETGAILQTELFRASVGGDVEPDRVRGRKIVGSRHKIERASGQGSLVNICLIYEFIALAGRRKLHAA
jgi:hypothetical protein